MPRIYDITRPLSAATALWPGDPPVSVEPVASPPGAPAVSALRLSTHSGTHVDPPAHFLPGGATVDELPLGAMIGPARVLSLGDVDAALPGATRLLVRMPGPEAALPAATATRAVAGGVVLVGCDSLSLDGTSSIDFPAQRALLSAGVVVVHDLDLSGVPDGEYTVVCLPLRIAGGDGAPARVVLVDSGW